MKKETLEAAEKEPQNPRSPSHARLNLDEPFDRIYERYGTDLSAFFRDAYHEVSAKRRALALEKCAKNGEG